MAVRALAPAGMRHPPKTDLRLPQKSNDFSTLLPGNGMAGEALEPSDLQNGVKKVGFCALSSGKDVNDENHGVTAVGR